MSGKAVRETLAALGVIASLVFVGVEIQQNTAVARSQARNDLATLNQEWLMQLASDLDLSGGFDAHFSDEETKANVSRNGGPAHAIVARMCGND